MADSSLSAARLPRRSFLRYAGATAGTSALLLAGCKKDDSGPATPSIVDVGSGDAGALNLALALEQIELAFYLAVQQGDYYKNLAADSAERQVLDDLALHENQHVQLLRNQLTAANSIRVLTTDFSGVNFNLRLAAAGATTLGVLDAARALEDLGVAAYNGAARYITGAINLMLTAKIVSVEARHAALIRDLIAYNSFVGGDIIDTFVPSGAPGMGTGSGLERTLTPAQVVVEANKFLKEGSKLTAPKLV